MPRRSPSDPAAVPNDDGQQTGARALAAVARAARHPPYRRAAVVIVVALGVCGLFLFTYVDALSRPAAQAVEVAVVGSTTEGDRFIAGLQRSTSGGLRLVPYPDAASADSAIDNQHVYAAVRSAAGEPVQLELSSASGSSVARVLSQAVPIAEQLSGVRVAVSDRNPLPAADPSGLAAFYLTIAATLLGFLTTFQLRANAKPLPLRPWLVATGALVVLGSLVLVTVATALLGLPFPFAESWLIVALQMTAASAFAGSLSVLIGPWALVPTWLVFTVLGNASSGGAVAQALLPEPFSALSRWLPSGAMVEAMRSAAYFPSGVPTGSLVVLSCWAVAAVVALVFSSVVRGRSPGQD